MKIPIVLRALSKEDWKNRQFNPEVYYCGYLEVDSIPDDIWDLCNYSCWSRGIPEECKNLYIDHCNSDMAYRINGTWYNHEGIPFESADQCYNELMSRNSKYFSALWPKPEKSIKISKIMLERIDPLLI